ncbi:hypothetical protein SAMN04487897_102550 [Paenibacillus sp. yr247]|uniref:hypothetical protein n=1 Tax=Paenibacillus sp. yr247 TaxID=1761880 RepID=UPI00088D07F6|nr:hypothetical protein [Paenibacillus sp. yr247]SDN33626.1 hypothetical protein SAMN04487897_102550 [Paenibacillus sp. yr247]
MKNQSKLLKVFSLFLAIAILTMGASTAFADDPNTPTSAVPGTVTNGDSTVTSVTYATYDVSQIDPLYNQLLNLRQQEKDLDVSMKAQHDTNYGLIKGLYSQVSKEDISKLKAISDQNKVLRETNKPLFIQWNELNHQYQVSRKMKDEKKTVELRLQINALKSQIQPIFAQIKSNEASVKDVRDRVNAERKQINSILGTLKPLQQQETTLWSTIKSTEQQRNGAWKVFNTAVDNGDISAAVQSLAQVVSYKQQIIDLKKQVYTVQQQIGTMLSSVTLNASTIKAGSSTTTTK